MSKEREILPTRQKALKVNLDPKLYGTFAEIGAGQEVARYFFQAGAAKDTIASTISAYDMAYSDAVYGKACRYVHKERLVQMLDKEFTTLTDLLSSKRDEDTSFFCYANTVSARNYYGTNECHGWMGLRFESKESNEVNDIIIHMRMLDDNVLSQQQAVGAVGVNLIYASFFETENMDDFISSLMDGVSNKRVEIDMIYANGPEFKDIDNRVLALKLVKKEMSPAVLFEADGSVVQPSDVLYKKNIIILRGSFRPPTHLNMDMLKTGQEMFFIEDDVDKENVVPLTNITLSNLRTTFKAGDINEQDFLDRVDLLGSLGQRVLVTLFTDYYKINRYLARFKNPKVRFILGIYNLLSLFEEKNHTNLGGGIMEAFGRTFSGDTKLFIYPYKENDKQIKDCKNFDYPEHLKHLYRHLIENEYLVPVKNYHEDYFSIWSREVLKKIQNGDNGWEDSVPKQVVEQVKQKCLFGYPCAPKK